jgi:hypothetical protein
LGIDPNPPRVPKGFQFLKCPLEVRTCPNGRGPVHADVGPRSRGRSRVRADAARWGCRPIRVCAYIIPVQVHFFCSFSPSPLVEVVGFALLRTFQPAEGIGVTSILRRILL